MEVRVLEAAAVVHEERRPADPSGRLRPALKAKIIQAAAAEEEAEEKEEEGHGPC